ncbi:hypothetical protein ACTXT7_011947 [Hymenolepis weldensis]
MTELTQEVFKRVTDFQKEALKSQFDLIKETSDMYQDLLMELQEAQNALYRIPAEFQNDNQFFYILSKAEYNHIHERK